MAHQAVHLAIYCAGASASASAGAGGATCRPAAESSGERQSLYEYSTRDGCVLV